MSKFPNSSLGINGNRVTEKNKIDGELFFSNLGALGPDWGEGFVSPMSCAFTDGSEKYKLALRYGLNGKLSQYVAGVASIGTDLFLCGSSSVRPSKYNIASDSWSEGSMAYNDYGSLDVSTGAFGYGGNAYFYTNNPGMGTAANFFELKKYNPVANTWTTLTSLSSSNLGTVVYGFMGIASGYAYFMQMIKSSNATYVPTGFPTVYRYQFSSNSWSSALVTPPLVPTGGLATSEQGHDFFVRSNNAVSCQMSSTEFLIHVKGHLTSSLEYGQAVNTEEIYKFDVSANTFAFLCRFKPCPDDISSIGPWNSTSEVVSPFKKHRLESKVYYNDGIVYLWQPTIKGLKAYSIADQKQYFVPISSSGISFPMSCYENGKIYMFSGYTSEQSDYPVINNNGIIIDLAAISAFLNKGKTLAVSVRSFD